MELHLTATVQSGGNVESPGLIPARQTGT